MLLLLQLVPGGDAASGRGGGGGEGGVTPGGLKVVGATISRIDELGLEVVWGKVRGGKFM